MTDNKTKSREVAAKRAPRVAATPGKSGWARPLLVTAGLTAGAWLLRRTLPGRIALGALKFAPLLLPLIAAKAVEDADSADAAHAADEADEAKSTDPTSRRTPGRASGRTGRKPASRAASGSARATTPGVG